MWTAPERTWPAYVLDEREMLEAWLEFHRATLLRKCAGLTGEQLVTRSCPPSSLTLLGLVRHMAEVERGWFRGGWQGKVEWIYCTEADLDADFNQVGAAGVDDDLAVYLAELGAVREEAARHALDDVVVKRRGNGTRAEISLRWIYTHMIEEYARHNGHADLLREAIDGATGD